MTEFIEAREGMPFQLDGKESTITRGPRGLYLDVTNGFSKAIALGEIVAKEWEVVRPYPTDAFNDEIDPGVSAVLIKRPTRYRTALAARAFIKGRDLHEEAGPVGLRALFRSFGGTVIQPGGLSDRDAERFPGRTARIHGPGDITIFLQDGEDQACRNELMALVIAVQELRWETYEDCYYQGSLDLSLGDARNTHPVAHFFAAMLLVPQDYAARAVDIPSAESVGAELKVEPATVQDAHQLWNAITNPEQPRS
ncbi:hypothetical protein [Arthrobacter sp. UYCo732]|uniref:hypothetical protein n=1 Tax=Arthrobacter sp. UYCo732 TaxID=3156336 RepID=UPI003399F43E